MGHGAIEMEQLLTANVASSMYWLGRYLERIESALVQIYKAYDDIIDKDKKAGKVLYRKYDIDLKYVTAVDFLNRAIRGNHVGNVVDMMQHARENAIIGRTNIDKKTFGGIISLSTHMQKIQKSPSHVECNEIDQALSFLNEIRGSLAHREDRKLSDYFLKVGRLVEEIDFCIRFDISEKTIETILKEIDMVIKILNPDIDLFDTCSKKNLQSDMMNCIYSLIDQLIVED